MNETEEEIKKRNLPYIFSMGNLDLIFQLELTEEDLLKPLSKTSTSYKNNNGEDINSFKLENINTIKDLKFLTERKKIWNKIKLEGGNPTLNQLLIANQELDSKCIINYIAYGPLIFGKEESFFNEIFNFVTLKYYLMINSEPLDKNASSTLKFELTYKCKTKTINYDPSNNEKEKEEIKNNNVNEYENMEQSENKNLPQIKRSESILFNIKPSLKKYDLVFLNYIDIKRIPGDFQMDDLLNLLNFFKNKGSIIFINFLEKEKEKANNEDDNEIDNNDNYSKDDNESEIQFSQEDKNKLYELSQIYFFDTLQAQKMFIKHFNENKNEDSETIELNTDNEIIGYFFDYILAEIKEKIKENKTSFFLNNLEIFTTASLIKGKTYRKKYECELCPKLEEDNEEKVNEYKEIIEENKIDLYSILISFYINAFANDNKNFHLFKKITPVFETAIKYIKKKIELIKYIKNNQIKEIEEDEVEEEIDNQEEQGEEGEGEEEFDSDNKKEKLRNIIYLIDTTYSMSKYENIIYSIEDLNQELINIYDDIKIGYVLYKDFLLEIENELEVQKPQIKIIEPSSELINIQGNENFIFEGGDDFAEDWANALNEISQLKLGETGNIVIHICDSGAHGHRFSDYCNNNEQENILVDALNNCCKSNIRIIGLIINNYTKKSFFECKKIYNEFEGYYNIVDMLDLINNNFDKESFINIIKENIENALNFFESDIGKNSPEEDIFQNDLEEDDFIFEGEEIKMRKLSQIEEYQDKNFCFLPQVESDEEIEYIQGIRQGAIGDCYLISSILSIAIKFPDIFKYIFPNLDYDENSDLIKMYVYKNGIKKLISFKNTYATKDEKNLLFAKPYNNELYGIVLEKGYAISKCENTLQSGYEKIVGGSGYQVFETLLGCSSEKYKSSHEYFKNYIDSYKDIDKDKLREKIKKYIDYRGMITFGVYYNDHSAHEYSLQGYKIDKKNEMFLEIINPHRSGSYIFENIFVEEEYNKLSQEEKEEFDQRKTPRIDESYFTTRESINSLKSYYKTGYLLLSLDAFFNWFGSIDICDPMFGSSEQTLIFLPIGSNLYSIDFQINKKTKFKLSLTDEINPNNSDYKIELMKDSTDLIISEENDYLIYELLNNGNYNLKITSKNEEIKNKIYIKIQCYEKIKIDVDIKKNNVIIIENDNTFYDVYNQMNHMNQIFKHLQICCHNKKIKLFSKPDDSNIYYRRIEFTEENGILDFPNFYFDYQNTKSGFCLNIINKFKFENENSVLYSSSGEDLLCSTKHGKYKITQDLIMTDFDEKFKNFLISQGFEGDQIDLKEFEYLDDSDLQEDTSQTQKAKSGCCLVF